MTKWDKRFIALAEHIAEWSKDRSTKVGCIIVDGRNRIVSTGYNGFPSGSNDELDSRHERPAKYAYTEHAERNAIYTAANLGISLEGKKLYVNDVGLFFCVDCARAIIQSGIKEVWGPKINPIKYPQWEESNKIALELFEECGVKINYIQ